MLVVIWTRPGGADTTVAGLSPSPYLRRPRCRAASRRHPPHVAELHRAAAHPASRRGRLSVSDGRYAEICEILGTSAHMEFAAQCTNCTSPDTGNMEVRCMCLGGLKGVCGLGAYIYALFPSSAVFASHARCVPVSLHIPRHGANSMHTCAGKSRTRATLHEWG